MPIITVEHLSKHFKVYKRRIGHVLFAPTYVLESDAIIDLNTHMIRFFHDSGKFPLMSNLKVECVFPDSAHIQT